VSTETPTETVPTAEAAELLGVHPSTLTRWVARKKITPVLRGSGGTGEMFFDPADIKRLRDTSPVRG